MPSGSLLADPSKVTDVFTGALEGDEITATGGLSLIVTVVEADPVEPLLSVAITVIVNTCDIELPVFV